MSENEETNSVASAALKESLLQQIKEKKESNAIQKQETNEVHVPENASVGEQVAERGEEESQAFDSKTENEKILTLNFDNQNYDIPEDAILEIKVDGKIKKMTLRELRDAASGGIAVRNRMRLLAEEKKNLRKPFQDFVEMAQEDPLRSLKKLFNSIKQIDKRADFQKFLTDLGKQAQKLAEYSPSERKAFELEQDLEETKATLSEKERLANIVEKKQELMETMGLTEEEILSYGQQLLSNPVLSQSISDEDELMDRIGDLADEVARQQAVLTALRKRNDKIRHDDPLVFELSSVLQSNPDFDEDDLEEIVENVMSGVKKSRATQAISKRQRSNVLRGNSNVPKNLAKMSPKDALMAQIVEKKKMVNK